MKKWTLPVALSAVILTCLGVWLYWKTRSVEWHAHHILDCIEQKNADCVSGYARDHELSALGISRSKFNEILQKELFANIVGYESASRTRITNGGADYQDVNELLHMNEGTSIGVEIKVAETDDGIKSPYIVAQVLGPKMYDRYRTMEIKNTSLRILAMKLAWAEAEGPRLEEQYGLKGVYKSDQEGLITWSEYVSRARSKFAEVQAKLASVGKGP